MHESEASSTTYPYSKGLRQQRSPDFANSNNPLTAAVAVAPTSNISSTSNNSNRPPIRQHSQTPASFHSHRHGRKNSDNNNRVSVAAMNNNNSTSNKSSDASTSGSTHTYFHASERPSKNRFNSEFRNVHNGQQQQQRKKSGHYNQHNNSHHVRNHHNHGHSNSNGNSNSNNNNNQHHHHQSHNHHNNNNNSHANAQHHQNQNHHHHHHHHNHHNQNNNQFNVNNDGKMMTRVMPNTTTGGSGTLPTTSNSSNAMLGEKHIGSMVGISNSGRRMHYHHHHHQQQHHHHHASSSSTKEISTSESSCNTPSTMSPDPYSMKAQSSNDDSRSYQSMTPEIYLKSTNRTLENISSADSQAAMSMMSDLECRSSESDANEVMMRNLKVLNGLTIEDLNFQNLCIIHTLATLSPNPPDKKNYLTDLIYELSNGNKRNKAIMSSKDVVMGIPVGKMPTTNMATMTAATVPSSSPSLDKNRGKYINGKSERNHIGNVS